MKAALQWLVIAVLVSVYLLTLFAVLHPKVSSAYRSYYIERTTSDWNPEHYSSTPEEGIEFSREGLPGWVDSTYGFSFRDPLGRWTDADVATSPGLAFTRPFNGSLCLKFTARPAASVTGKTFAVQMGNQTKTLQALPAHFAEYQVEFTEVRGADKLSFLLPEKLPRESEVHRQNGDTRRLGLELVTLRILPGNCGTTGAQPETRQ